MIDYILYQHAHTIIYETSKETTYRHHLTYILNQLMKHQINDLNSYLKNYKKNYGNQYQIPIFMNTQTTFIIMYGYRSQYNIAINIHAIEKMISKEGKCVIQFKQREIDIQKSCRYIKDAIDKGYVNHTKILESIFI